MDNKEFAKRLQDRKIYDPVGDYAMVTTHAHLVDRMYFYGKQRERYHKEVDFITSIVSQNSVGRKIIDVGCGTGVHIKLLRERGFAVSGFDLRKEMVEVAKKRNPNQLIIQGDMRSFPLEGRVNGIITMYGAINYIDKEEDIEKTLQNFSDHLTHDGVAIIDTRYQPNLDEEVRMWSTDSWVLVKRWVKCRDGRDSVYRVFYAIHDEGVMEMEDHRQFFQDPFWIADKMKKVGFVRAKVFDSYDINREFDPTSGSALSVVVGYKQ